MRSLEKNPKTCARTYMNKNILNNSRSKVIRLKNKISGGGYTPNELMNQKGDKLSIIIYYG